MTAKKLARKSTSAYDPQAAAERALRPFDTSQVTSPEMLDAISAELAKEFFAFTDSPQCRAWMRLVELLGEAKLDPIVCAVPAAREFAEMAQRKAGDSLEVQQVVDLRKAVDHEYRALTPTQQGSSARGIIARKLGVSPQSVGPHLIALGVDVPGSGVSLSSRQGA